MENSYPRTFSKPLRGEVHNKILLFKEGRGSFSTCIAVQEIQKSLQTDVIGKFEKNPNNCLCGLLEGGVTIDIAYPFLQVVVFRGQMVFELGLLDVIKSKIQPSVHLTC